MPVTTPLPPDQRAPLLDALRGFALFGVCLANLYVGFALLGAPGAPPPESLWTAPADRAAGFLVRMLVDGKFYSIFSLLFGIGFAMQMSRAEASGDPEMRRFRRRLWVLFAIGMVHLCLIWRGDILAFYALVGFILIRFRHASDRRLLVWAAALIPLAVLLWAAYWATGGASAKVPATPAIPFFLAAMGIGQLLGVTAAGPDLLNGGWAAFAQDLATGPFFRYAALAFEWRILKVLSMFLLGLWLGRRRPWTGLEAWRPLLRRAAFWGLLVGLPASAAMAALDGSNDYYQGTTRGLAHAALYALGVAPLALGYAALFAMAWTTGVGRAALGWLAPLGRMALTSYLMQSVFGVLLFYDIGLGLGGRIGPALLWPLTAGIVGGQAAFATVWLRHFRFGPAEWVWRSLTYAQPQPMRLAAAPPERALLSG